MITAVSQNRQGDVVTVKAESDLAGVVYYHFWIDGVLVDSIASDVGFATRGFGLAREEQARIDIADTTDPDADPVSLLDQPLVPRRINLQWVRSLDSDVGAYDIYHAVQNGGLPALLNPPTPGWEASGWTKVGTVPHDETLWIYSFLTGRVSEMEGRNSFLIVPIDQAGNAGSALLQQYLDITAGLFPADDAPNFTVTFDGGTGRVTFHAA